MAYDPNRGIDQNTYNDRTGSINQWFKQYTGRDASNEDFNRAYVGNFGTVENDIRNSDEAKAFAAKSQQQTMSQPWDRSKFVNGWLPLGNDVNAQNAYLQQWGLDPGKISGNGQLTMPDGSIMDIRRGAKIGDNTAQWMGIPSQMGTPGAPPPGQPGQPGTPLGGKWDALYNELMTRAHQSLAVDPNDPIIKNQVDANEATQERSRRRFLSAQAESSSPYATGAALGQDRMTSEQLGQNVAGFQSELMGRELTARRAEIQSALSGAQGMLSQEQQISLQKELAMMDDQLKRYSIDTNNDQFNKDLAFKTDDRNNYWDWTRSGGQNPGA